MSSHRAMKELAENPEAVRALARYLIACGQRAGDAPVSWTDWEVDFLDSMAQRKSAEPLSMRQREILTELKSAAQRTTSVDGFSVRGLVERCWLERFDLDDEDDQRFIEDLKAAGVQSVTGRQRGRLLACCRELGIIERHQGF
jgi:hypothetical protein